MCSFCFRTIKDGCGNVDCLRRVGFGWFFECVPKRLRDVIVVGFPPSPPATVRPGRWTFHSRRRRRQLSRGRSNPAVIRPFISFGEFEMRKFSKRPSEKRGWQKPRWMGEGTRLGRGKKKKIRPTKSVGERKRKERRVRENKINRNWKRPHGANSTAECFFNAETSADRLKHHSLLCRPVPAAEGPAEMPHSHATHVYDKRYFRKRKDDGKTSANDRRMHSCTCVHVYVLAAMDRGCDCRRCACL